MGLSVDEVSRYARDGYVIPIPVVDPHTATAYREDFNALAAREGREASQIGLLDRHYTDVFIWRLASHEAILDAVESLLGPDILLLATHVFCKYGEPGGRKYVAWHQDVTYWGLEPPMALTAWYAIDDADTENGCMQVIPGSHLDGVLDHGVSDADGNLLSINQEVRVSPEDVARATDFVLPAGHMSLHHGQLVHGSLPNQSSRRRAGLTIRYITPDVRQAERNSYGRGWRPVLVRGEDRHGHFDLCDAPFAR
ncbi:phytanoyl-CoA dioxygenase family protein [Candidatus Poribacteria bacterium]|jgi:non-haem Fe2+, alpha-ketoglutarate-dependent halogenase|nr:phytanoyl-CoA dioxygenase family protein [Candidatus Poribacteria bacterium]MBT5532489.1 phytanoyl-CoA dioxygenase family protein [Candidatus Poribacteria bacterium]MBT5714087.1 phytanoyl-CoA dioxygenase family protein [Candidatus Poribacteria bacterium]MBT7100941.1 phytanoyl-CoA dioxygenase family protein [Candidatus Poribacteria bacterium]MBT7808339.1 phytanoyl-CoA dioxygenase family protein [Candidatus Poribacteria bacterium]